jgi:hypothetical protein
VIKRSLKAHIKDGDVKQQRKNIFHTKCHISNRVYSIIIDSENCTNIASTTLLLNLNLNIIKHE